MGKPTTKKPTTVAKLEEQFEAPSAPASDATITVTMAPPAEAFKPEVVVSAIQLQKKQEAVKMKLLAEQLKSRSEELTRQREANAKLEELRKQLRARSEEILGELRSEAANLEYRRDMMLRGKGQMEERIRQVRDFKAKRDAVIIRIEQLEANLSKG